MSDRFLVAKALEEEGFDSYSCTLSSHGYEVKVTKGTQSGVGVNLDEAKAYAAAKKNLSHDPLLAAQKEAEAAEEERQKKAIKAAAAEEKAQQPQ